MDEDWALKYLDSFINATFLVSSGEMSFTRRPVGDEEDITASAPIVEKILDRVTPRWRDEVPVTKSYKWEQRRVASIRARTEITHAAEIAEKLGERAPTLSAGAMHPWVWEAARSLWQSGHYAEAVRAATVKVNAELQNKMGRRDQSEAALFQVAFSNDAPTSDAPRLRPRGDDGGKTSTSVRRGIVALAEGIYGSVRNPLSHDVGELEEQVALEQLAVVSVLARRLDDSNVVHG